MKVGTAYGYFVIRHHRRQILIRHLRKIRLVTATETVFAVHGKFQSTVPSVSGYGRPFGVAPGGKLPLGAKALRTRDIFLKDAI